MFSNDVPVRSIENVTYGYRQGNALQLACFSPLENANGLGLILMVSWGWESLYSTIDNYKEHYIEPLLKRGYTVIAAVPSSRPDFSILEMKEDARRALRYIRLHAKEFSIDPERLGVYGFSAGGHLSLLAGLTSDAGNPDSEDEVERESNAVKAIAEFYGPTDFLNYSKTGENGLGRGLLHRLQDAFNFQEFDPETKSHKPITDEERLSEIGRQCSPINYLRPDSPPILIIHGTADEIVPFYQSELFLERAQQVGANVELEVIPDKGHSWEDMSREVELMADWFDRNL
jgi:acetyl esterase/lipase